jgi:ubiquinone/menaquinone biosynthesis C-methylase UbiE
VDDWLVNTNGNLYWKARGRLKRYSIPAWPSVAGENKVLLDIGCGWGWWTMSVSRAGLKSVGVDIHSDALSAAQRVTAQIGAASEYVCGDPRDYAFFVREHVRCVFLQRFPTPGKEEDKSIFKEILRILKPGGFCLIQLPNTFGIFNLVRQAIRGFRQAQSDSFEMR